MAVSNIPKVPRDGTVTLQGATLAAYTLDYEDGDVNVSEIGTAERIVIRDRGAIVAVRQGDDPVITITMTVSQRDFTDGSSATLWDVIAFTGSRAADTKTTDTKGDFKFLTCVFTDAGTAHGDTADHTLTAKGCVATMSFAEGKPNKYTLTLEVHAGLTRTGQA